MFIIEDTIESVKKRTLMPVSQNTFDNAAILLALNETLIDTIVPEILGVRENFFQASKTDSLVANVPYMALPPRAIGNALKAAFLVDSAGNKKPLNTKKVEEQDMYTSTGEPEGFYIEGDEVRLVPTPSSSVLSLEQLYFQRPNELVLTEECAKITGISSVGGTTTFTVNTDLTADLSVGSKVDFLSTASPFLLWAKDVAITAITSTTIAVATTGVDNEVGTVEPQVDDYICPKQKANYAQIPGELHPWLCQETGCFILEALGHMDKLQAARAKADRMKSKAMKMIASRVEVSPEVVVNRYGFLGR